MKKWSLTLCRNLLCVLAILPAALFALLHLPVVQQRLMNSVTGYLHKKTGYHIQCDAFRFTWFRHIALEHVTVTDAENKPLFAIEKCKGKLNLFSLCLLKPDMIDTVSVTGGQFYLAKNSEQAFNMAAFYTKVMLPFIPETNTDLSIDTIQLHNINLYYDNPIKKQKIKVEHINLAISDFFSASDYHSGNLTTFSYQETSDIPLVCKNLITQFKITPDRVLLKNCHMVTKHSMLQGDFTLQQTKQGALFTNYKDLALEAILHKTVFSSIELSKFVPLFKGADRLYKLDGSLSLSPHAIVWKNCRFAFGSSYIESTGSYNGVDADLCVQAGIVHMDDLPKNSVVYPTALQYICIAHATLLGNTQKAKITGNITTNIGAIQTNLTLFHLGKPMQNLTGKISLGKVVLDAILPDFPIQSLSGTISVKVQGDHFNTLDAQANLSEIQINDYTYKEIEASCVATNAIVAFKLHSRDTHAKLTAVGRYHMAHQKSLKADGIIEQLHLDKLGLSPVSLSLSTKFSFSIRDILTKRPRGEIILNECVAQRLGKKVTCKQILLHALADGHKDVLTLTSPLIDARLQGLFTVNDLVSHIRHLITHAKNPVALAPIPAQFHLDYAINCKKIFKILNWFSDNLYISTDTKFLGHFAYDQDYHFSFHLPAASHLTFKRFSFENIKAKLNVAHLIDAKKRLIQVYIASDKQDWHQIFQTDHLYFQLRMHKNEFVVSHRLSNHQDHLSIDCLGRLMGDAVQVDLLPSQLTIQKQAWTIQTEGSSFISRSAISIGNLSITNGQSSICIGGKLAQSATKDPLHCTIRHLALNCPSAVGPLSGIIDTKLVAHLQKDQIVATGRLTLKEVTIQDYAVGTFSTKVDWNVLENKLVLAGMLQKKDQLLLQIDGCYHLMKPFDNLAITTTFNHMDLSLLNLLFASVCSDISGNLSGQFQLAGSLTAPKVTGSGTIDKGKFKINYLNTCYQVAGPIKVQKNRLYVNQLDLYDNASGHATLSGHIAIQDDCPLMLSGDMETFHLLQTTRTDNPDFYGDLYATGTLQMEGSICDLLFKIKATTDRGAFTIVAHDKEDIENTTRLVQFVYNKVQKQPDKATKNQDQSTIKLILDLTILPTVKAQVLFGSYNRTNDILQGQGTGAIQLEVGTNRKPYVMGNYLFESGTYTVSVYNLIQKTFTITPNSQVNFNGYPQEGIVHINASYRQTASIADLYPDRNHKRPIPVEIGLSAYGTLAHPHVAYQLCFPEKSINAEINTELEKCASKALLDKHYLNKQILSLLIAKRVYNEKRIDGWDAISNSINDFLSQRIQNLVSKIDHNLEIETDLGMNKSENQSFFQKTSIKVSYLLLSENLRLSSTVGGYSRFINDWEIAYRISKVHNMHAKLYQQPLNSTSSLALFGISFGYTKKFW